MFFLWISVSALFFHFSFAIPPPPVCDFSPEERIKLVTLGDLMNHNRLYFCGSVAPLRKDQIISNNLAENGNEPWMGKLFNLQGSFESKPSKAGAKAYLDIKFDETLTFVGVAYQGHHWDKTKYNKKLTIFYDAPTQKGALKTKAGAEEFIVDEKVIPGPMLWNIYDVKANRFIVTFDGPTYARMDFLIC